MWCFWRFFASPVAVQISLYKRKRFLKNEKRSAHITAKERNVLKNPNIKNYIDTGDVRKVGAIGISASSFFIGL